VLPMSGRLAVPQHWTAPPAIGRVRSARRGGARSRQSSGAEGEIDDRDRFVASPARVAHGAGLEREPAWPRLRLGGRPVGGSVCPAGALRRTVIEPVARTVRRTDACPD